MTDIEEFISAMRSAGLETSSDILADGKLNRFHIEGDRPGSKNGWYVLFGDDAPAGVFGSWKQNSGEPVKWFGNQQNTLTPEQRSKQAEKIKQARQFRHEEEEKVRAECRRWCGKKWDTLPGATGDHPYLKSKGAKSYGLKLYKGSLVIKLKDATGSIQGIQFIAPDGSKKFKTGTSKKGNYFAIGKPKENTLLLCEGYATGASLHECTDHAVAVCFDAGNMIHVAKALRKKLPDYTLIMCGDNDVSGVGQKAAQEAALAVGGLVALPPEGNHGL